MHSPVPWKWDGVITGPNYRIVDADGRTVAFVEDARNINLIAGCQALYDIVLECRKRGLPTNDHSTGLGDEATRVIDKIDGAVRA
jgi:hypothetical protein